VNYLYYGDNLDVIRESVATASVDLVYLDPPFNSNRSYNVLFADRSGKAAQAQIEAFDDTWTWSQDTEAAFKELVRGDAPARVADAIDAMRRLLGDNDVLAYLVMMTQRLVELHRVLKPTGSLYLHCDPTASHYLKMLLDAIFGSQQFLNEVIWERSGAKNDPRRYGRGHDVILFYSKGKSFTWNTQYLPFSDASIAKNYTHIEPGTGRRYRRDNLTANKAGGDTDFEWNGVRPYAGRHWAYSRQKLDQMAAEGRIEYRRTGMPVYKRYLDEQPGVPLQDVWTGIRLTSADRERLGYPTQKPESLLERIITASSNEGDVVLDPFCGCGTTVAVAQRLRRQWVGIDITFIAIDLIDKRLRDTYGEEIRNTYTVYGIPRDVGGARKLFEVNPFDFERWAVAQVGGQPHERAQQAGDKGVDGWIRFPISDREIGRVVVSVKGGRQLNPAMVRDLRGTVESQRADLGMLITLDEPTRGMREEARRSGTYTHPLTHHSYPLLQVVTVSELLAGRQPDLPAAFLPYVQAQRGGMAQQRTLGI
jgi:DNA modification methylase